MNEEDIEIIELDRMALKEEFRHLPLVDIKLEHFRIVFEDNIMYVLVDGDEEWQKRPFTLRGELMAEEIKAGQFISPFVSIRKQSMSVFTPATAEIILTHKMKEYWEAKSNEGVF